MYKFDCEDMCSLMGADEETREAMRREEYARIAKIRNRGKEEETIPSKDGMYLECINLDGEVDKISLPIKGIDSWESDLLASLPLIYGPSNVKRVLIVSEGKVLVAEDWPFTR